MSLEEPVRQEISQLITANEVVLFMKGNRRAPKWATRSRKTGRRGEPAASVYGCRRKAGQTRDGGKIAAGWGGGHSARDGARVGVSGRQVRAFLHPVGAGRQDRLDVLGTEVEEGPGGERPQIQVL